MPLEVCSLIAGGVRLLKIKKRPNNRMKHTKKMIALATMLATSTQASVIITDVQSGLTGITVPTVQDDTGILRHQTGVGTFASLTDGDSGTFTTNFGAGAAGDLGFIGIRFNTPQDNVESVQLDIRTFVDGGWFNGGEGVEPVIQVTTSAAVNGWVENQNVGNGDNIWTTITASTDYVTGVNETTGAGANGAGIGDNQTFTWTFNTAQNNITAIRILGSEGGTAGPRGSFLGASEIRAYATPEPSSTALLGLGGLALILRRRK